MRHIFVCPTNDAFKIAMVDVTVDRKIRGGIEFETYTPKEPPLYPFVPAYFQEYNQQRRCGSSCRTEHSGSARGIICLCCMTMRPIWKPMH